MENLEKISHYRDNIKSEYDTYKEADKDAGTFTGNNLDRPCAFVWFDVWTKKYIVSTPIFDRCDVYIGIFRVGSELRKEFEILADSPSMTRICTQDTYGEALDITSGLTKELKVKLTEKRLFLKNKYNREILSDDCHSELCEEYETKLEDKNKIIRELESKLVLADKDYLPIYF